MKNYLIHLLSELLNTKGENESVEYKVDNEDPEKIGENISALSNSAALHGKAFGYIVWGVENTSLKVVGTNFEPKRNKVSNEELENWLLRLLSPRVDFKIHSFLYNDVSVVIFEIPAAKHQPTAFKSVKFIRVGSYTKRLSEFPEKERTLWKSFESYEFETEIAKDNLERDDVLALLDYEGYYKLVKQSVPADMNLIIDRFIHEGVVQKALAGKYMITNLGAILFAKDLSKFSSLANKALRVIFYNGKNRVKTQFERQGQLGYAVGFEKLVKFINNKLPISEEISTALREECRIYPEKAIRELVANALIHQDFTIKGAAPKVEIFDDRIEFSNPGKPLIEILRFIDQPSRSRNEKMTSFLRKLNICEERGSGIDKVVFEVELFQLPAPDFRIIQDNTIAILYAKKPYRNMSFEERIRACYQHACLKYVSNEEMTNSSLRQRFGIEESNYPMVSKIIAEALEKGLIKIKDPENKSKKHRSYIPYWA